MRNRKKEQGMSTKRRGQDKARIIQFADENKTLPDGSKVIYAENEEKIVVYHKFPLEKGTTYVYDRKTGHITVNGKVGNLQDKKTMLRLSSYMLQTANDVELVTITVNGTEG
jgi:hypothetical protein